MRNSERGASSSVLASGILRGGAMNNGMRGVGLPALAFLAAACGVFDAGGGDSRRAPEPTRVGAVQVGPFGVSGWNDVVAVWSEPLDSGLLPGPQSLRLYRQDAANANLLVTLGAVAPAAPSPVNFSVNEQWVVLHAIGTGSAGWVALVPTAGPYGSQKNVPLPAPADVATAWNDRLVAATGTELAVYEFANPGTPTRIASFRMGSAATAMTGTGAGVWVFTQAGYGWVDLARGTYQETPSADLARAARASAHGTKIHVAGPSRFAGNYRIATLDGSAPPALTVDGAADQIADGDSFTQDVADASFDALTGTFSLLQSGSSPTTGSTGTLLQYAANGTSYTSAGSGTLDTSACTVSCGPEERWMPRIHVHNRRAYVVPVQHQQASFYVYQLP